MKKLILLFSFFFFTASSQVDSLKELLSTATVLQDKKELIYNIADLYKYDNIDSSNHYISMISDTLTKIKSSFDAKTLHLYTTSLIEHGEHKIADSILQEVKNYYSKTNEIVPLSMVYNSLGLNSKNFNEISESFNYFDTGLDILQGDTIKYFKYYITIFFNRGHTYLRTSNFDKAIDDFYKALSLSEQYNMPDRSAQILMGISDCYETKSDFNKSKVLLKKVINLKEEIRESTFLNALVNLSILYGKRNKIDTAKYYIRQAITISENKNLSKINHRYYGTLANIHMVSNNLDSARHYLNKELSFMDSLKSPYNYGISLLNLGNTYINEKPIKSIPYFESAYDLLSKSGDNHLLQFLVMKIAKARYLVGDYKEAFDCLNEAYIIKDTIFDAQKVKISQDIEIKYETEKKVIENTLLNKELEIKKQTISKQRTYLLGGIIFVLLLCCILFLIYKQNKSKDLFNKQLQRKSEMISKLQEEQDHRLRNQMNLVLGLLEKYKSKENNSESLVSDLEQRLFALSSLSQLLSSKNLEDTVNLESYLSTVVSSLEFNTDLDVAKDLNVISDIDSINIHSNFALSIALIITELYTNSIKHAKLQKSGKIEIKVIIDPEENIKLNYSDNGKGFDRNKFSMGEGMNIIVEMINQLDGKNMILNKKPGFHFQAIIPS